MASKYFGVKMMDKKTKIEQLIREAHEKGIFTGTWLYAENGNVITKGAIGWRDQADSLPLQEESIFELASVSKQFTATAIMLLCKRGKISLEDDLSKFFPDNQYSGITVRHLLNHTSGLPDHERWIMDTLKERDVIPDNGIVSRFLKECKLKALFQAGEEFEYSNTGYCLLAEIVKQVSGMTFEDFMRYEVFEPSGMYATRICHIRRDGNPFDNFARGLVVENGKYMIPDDLESYNYVITLDGENGDGFIYSNIDDMLIWDRALREEKLLNKTEQMMLYTPGRLNNGRNCSWGKKDEAGYGFGWDVFVDKKIGRIVSHEGYWAGYSTLYERGIDSDRTLVVLCCRDTEDTKAADDFFASMQSIGRE